MKMIINAGIKKVAYQAKYTLDDLPYKLLLQAEVELQPLAQKVYS